MNIITILLSFQIMYDAYKLIVDVKKLLEMIK